MQGKVLLSLAGLIGILEYTWNYVPTKVIFGQIFVYLCIYL